MGVEQLLKAQKTVSRKHRTQGIRVGAWRRPAHSGRFLLIYLTCRRPGRIQIVRNHCLLWNYRRCRLGAVVAAARQRRFQTVESRFVVDCRPFLMRAIRPLTKININSNTPKYLLNVKTTLYNNIK